MSICKDAHLFIIPESIERFSLDLDQVFISVIQCAEPMTTRLCRLKAKITGKGHGIWHWILCHLHISFTPGMIFIKLVKGVHALRGYFGPPKRPKNENCLSQVSSF